MREKSALNDSSLLCEAIKRLGISVAPFAERCGHTYDPCDYEMNGTRVVCNPRGYVRSNHAENPEFNPALIVEI